MKNLEMVLKAIVKEAVVEVLSENGLLKGILANDVSEVAKDVVKAVKAVNTEVEEEVSTQDDEEEAVDNDRKVELEAMTYNEVKALVKALGGKAVGKKDDLIVSILELEANAEDADADDEVEETQEEAVEEVAQDEETEEVEEEDEEDGLDLAEILDALDIKDIKAIVKALGGKVAIKSTKDSLIDKIADADEDKIIEVLAELGHIELEEEDEEDEEEVEEVQDNSPNHAEDLGLNDMTVEELAEVCSDNDLSTKGKKQALIDRIVKAIEDGVIELEDEEEDESEEEEAPAQEEAKEVSPERQEAEEAIEKQIKKEFKSKKLKAKTIKDTLKKYNDGNPDCKDCKGCSEEDMLSCYIELMTSLIDDEGETHDLEEPYIRDGKHSCCGKSLKITPDKDLYCEACGETYEQE